jgi:Protein of unknown function (DUF2829)
MDFGDALARIRHGMRMQRFGWGGQTGITGKFVVLQHGYPDGIAINENTARATGIPQGTIRKFLPYFMVQNCDGTFEPWLPDASDLLADDWQEVQ